MAQFDTNRNLAQSARDREMSTIKARGGEGMDPDHSAREKEMSRQERIREWTAAICQR